MYYIEYHLFIVTMWLCCSVDIYINQKQYKDHNNNHSLIQVDHLNMDKHENEDSEKMFRNLSVFTEDINFMY